MRASALLPALLACLSAAQAQPSLRGTVTDPSGAAVPGAVVLLRREVAGGKTAGVTGAAAPGAGVHLRRDEAGAERRARTGDERSVRTGDERSVRTGDERRSRTGDERSVRTGGTGQYWFGSLAAGRYGIRILATGFAAAEKKDLSIDRPMVFDAQLAIQTKTEAVSVEDAPGRVGAEPEANGGAVMMRGRQLGVLSDDPDELALELQALAGPAPGPNGGQIFIDGFTGGNLPPKSAIREVRINANPFSPEYDRPGFARVEIFTKPGSESLRGQAFAQYNDEYLNSRNPLVAGSTRPPYRAQMYGLDLGGPLRKNRAAFTLDAEERQIDENAFILATTLDAGRNPVEINQAIETPQSRTMISPRIDYALSPRNTLVVRYQELRIGLDNQGVGDFNLASRAYRQTQAEHTLQITETAAISPRAINETRFQYMRLSNRDTAGSAAPAITVDGAFSEGGASTGNSASSSGNWELSNVSTYTKGRQTLKWGGRVRESRLDDTALGNFAGTFTFYTLAQYEQTLALQQAGYTGAEMAELGAGPSQFSLNSGTPTARVSQADAGIFAGDDWRARPNLTVSAGLRYEAQTNLGDRGDWAPRLGIAWGLDARANRPAKTVLRAGFGAFYDRIPLTATLNALRYNGITQESYLILDPTFFPEIPPPGMLQADSAPQQLQPMSSRNVAPRLYQSSLGIDRQLNGSSRVAVTWTGSRGTHLLDTRNINAPIGGGYPFGDPSIRLLTESAGFSRQNQLTASSNANWRKLMLFGFYSLSYGKDDNEGVPADPYNLRAEWGPSVDGDVRHRLALGASLPVAWKLTVTSFLVANSGLPYNITTGLDPGDTGYPAARPALVAGVSAAACQGNGLVYAGPYGCLDSNPAPGSAAIGRNYGRGPAAVNLALRISRTWAFGREGRTGLADTGTGEHGGGGAMPPHAMFTTNTGRKYSVTLSASTLNAPNHANYAPPDGDLSSPYFGQYRSLGGLMVMAHGGAPSTYNRKIDLQVRFTF